MKSISKFLKDKIFSLEDGKLVHLSIRFCMNFESCIEDTFEYTSIKFKKQLRYGSEVDAGGEVVYFLPWEIDGECYESALFAGDIEEC